MNILNVSELLFSILQIRDPITRLWILQLKNRHGLATESTKPHTDTDLMKHLRKTKSFQNLSTSSKEYLHMGKKNVESHNIQPVH